MPPIEFNLFKFLLKFPIWFFLTIPGIFFSCVIAPVLLNILYDWLIPVFVLSGPIGIIFIIPILVGIATVPLFIPLFIISIFAQVLLDVIFTWLTTTIFVYTGVFTLITGPFAIFIQIFQIFNIIGAIGAKMGMLVYFIGLWFILVFLLSIIPIILCIMSGMLFVPIVLILFKIILFFGGLFLTLGVGPVLIIFTGLGTVLSVNIEKWISNLWSEFKIPIFIMGIFILVMVAILTIAIILMFAAPLFGKIKDSMDSKKLKSLEKSNGLVKVNDKAKGNNNDIPNLE